MTGVQTCALPIFMGYNAGYNMTTGHSNTILGGYTGNQGGLDIRTSNNYIVLSDGDGTVGAYMPAGATTTARALYLPYGQINFPATQNASTDANTLDDYEEGTWTPVALTDSGSFSTTSVAGTYVKIGRQVTVNGFIRIDNIGTATNFIGFSGLQIGRAHV